MEQYLAVEPDAPVVCDLTTAPDTGGERLAEYGRLFAEHLAGRQRTAEGIRFRFRAADGVEAWVRSLAAREHACCPFLGSRVTRSGDEIHWDGWVADDDTARAVLAEFYRLPETFADGVEGLEGRLRDSGFEVISPAS
jgi:hypothetical protein